MKKHHMLVTIRIDDCSAEDTMQYVEQAIVGWSGSLWPQDPCFDIQAEDVTVTKLCTEEGVAK